METIQLRPYQYKAIDSVRTALNRGQRHIVVEMAAGTGKEIVFAKTVEFLHRIKDYKILVVVDHLAIKKQIISKISTNYDGFAEIVNDNIVVETASALIKNPNKQITQYAIVIFYDAVVSSKIYDILLCAEKTTVIFTTIGNEISNNKSANRLFEPNEVVFSYTFQ